MHEKYGSDIISSAYLFNQNHVYLWIADAAAARQITTNRLEYPKPLKMYKTISLYGPNIVAMESDEWKRHRRVVAPSFNEKNNRLVYEETARITTEMFDYWSNESKEVKVDNITTLTSRLALMVISAAGEYI